MISVLPINDIMPHDEFETTCPCGPALEIINGEMLLTHNSFDGRELAERKRSMERVVCRINNTVVTCLDEPGQGGACHKYVVHSTGKPSELLGDVNFQNGPILEAGINGVQNEDLLAIVIDRLEGFQSGNYACRDNAIALTKCQEALLWLQKRTRDRQSRGVEGKSIV